MKNLQLLSPLYKLSDDISTTLVCYQTLRASTSMSFLTTMQGYLTSYLPILPQAKVIVAVSGGPDSMALLFGLYKLRTLYDFSLIVAHVNHQLRGEESLRDQVFVSQQARHLGLPFYQTKVQVKAFQHSSGLSPQHAARQLRYHFLLALQQMLGATCIALGHTADDTAETLLVRFLRGSSPTSLAGIPAVRLPFIRPLIAVSRHTILTYVQAEHIPWIEDSSNTNHAYVRNRIRLELLPTLQQYNSQIRKRLHVLADLLQTDDDVLMQHVAEWSEKTLLWEHTHRVMIQCRVLRSAPLALQRRVLRQIVNALLPANKPVSFQHIQSLLQLIREGAPRQRCTLPGGVLAERQHEIACVWNPKFLPSTNLVLFLPVPGEVTLVGLHMRIAADILYHTPDNRKGDHEAYLNFSRIYPPLQIRFYKPGDRFTPLGMQGAKKLQDFFTDKKIRQGERGYIPLVINRGEIVWVVGHRISEPFKVHESTAQVLYLRCIDTEKEIL